MTNKSMIDFKQNPNKQEGPVFRRLIVQNGNEQKLTTNQKEYSQTYIHNFNRVQKQESETKKTTSNLSTFQNNRRSKPNFEPVPMDQRFQIVSPVKGQHI